MRPWRIIVIERKRAWYSKLDLEKAYDYRDWDLWTTICQEKVLVVNGKSGYAGCLESSRFSIMLNG